MPRPKNSTAADGTEPKPAAVSPPESGGDDGITVRAPASRKDDDTAVSASAPGNDTNIAVCAPAPEKGTEAVYDGVDVSCLPGAARVRTLPVRVTVCFAVAPGRLETLEGPVDYAPGDALITGPAGERWPVKPECFISRYRPVSPTLAGTDGTYEKCSLEVWSAPIPQAFTVSLHSGGGVLHGKPGDFLVQYGAAEYGVVDAAIFRQLYEII